MPGRQRRLASKSAFTSSVIDQVKLTRSKARPPNVLSLRSATEFNLTPGRPHLVALYAAAVWCHPPSPTFSRIPDPTAGSLEQAQGRQLAVGLAGSRGRGFAQDMPRVQ